MSDQCLKCNHFNRPDMCVGEDCSIKESWYVLYLTQQIAALTTYKEYNYDPSESIRLNGEIIGLKERINALTTKIETDRGKGEVKAE